MVTPTEIVVKLVNKMLPIIVQELQANSEFDRSKLCKETVEFIA
jgi:hypothetical protein